jgi:hypothetical protein
MLAALSGAVVQASPVNVVQAPTGYFVPTDAQKYDSPYYRWYGEDWGWTHGAVDAPTTSVTLLISAFDVDAPSEVDNIYAWENTAATWVLLGSLAGANDVWAYTTFTLGSAFWDDVVTGLQVKIAIDTATQGSWAVTLAKSVVTVDGGTPPPPNPTVPDGGATLMLLGGALTGLAALRRKF